MATQVLQNFILSWLGQPQSLGGQFSVPGNCEKNFAEVINPFSNIELDLHWSADSLQSIFIVSDVAIEVYTNHDPNETAGQQPTDAYPILANFPWFWCRLSNIPNPFLDSLSVTRFFVQNSNTADANVYIKSIINGTVPFV